MTRPPDIRIDENGDTWITYEYPPGSNTFVQVNQSEMDRSLEALKNYPITFDI